MPPQRRLQPRRQRREQHYRTWYGFRGEAHFTRLTIVSDPVDLELELRKAAAHHQTCLRAAYHEIELIRYEEICSLTRCP